jgi:DNA repair exonuclease SbcCD nuclease subunit
MAKTYFIGDLHLGAKFAYSTAATRERFVHKQKKTIEVLVALEGTLCFMGDVFDKFQVDVRTFVDAYQLLAGENCKHNLILAGNHDLSKNSNLQGSLQVLQEIGKANFTIGCWQVYQQGEREILLVSHCLTQELFDKTIEDIINHPRVSGHRTLVLHCNLGDWDGKSSENYLTLKQADRLSEVFDLMVSGHQHDYSVHNLSGCFMYFPGAICPMNFGELGDKYILELDDVTNEVVRLKISDLEDAPQFTDRLIDAADFLGDDLQLEDDIDFITVFGDTTPSANVEVTKKLQRILATHPTVIAAKPNITVIRKEELDGGRESPTEVTGWLGEVMERLNEEGHTYLANLENGIVY